MAFFEVVISMCSMFRLFGGGAISAGVACEIASAIGLGIPMRELLETISGRHVLVDCGHLDVGRVLDDEQTRTKFVERRAA